MAAETTIGISYETRDALDDIGREIRTRGGQFRALTRDDVIRELLADHVELARIQRHLAAVRKSRTGIHDA